MKLKLNFTHILWFIALIAVTAVGYQQINKEKEQTAHYKAVHERDQNLMDDIIWLIDAGVDSSETHRMFRILASDGSSARIDTNWYYNYYLLPDSTHIKRWSDTIPIDSTAIIRDTIQM